MLDKQRYKLSAISEMTFLHENREVAAHILAHKGISGLAELLQQQVLITYSPHPQKSKPILQRLAKHYTRDQIAHAIATAWANNSDTFELPKLSLVQRYGKIKIAALVTLLSVVPIMTWGILALRKEYPEIIGGLLVFEPLLALPGVMISVLLFVLIIKWWR